MIKSAKPYLRSHSLMNADQGHAYFMVLFGKPYKKFYLTFHLCPFMTLQRQMNVIDSSMGLCCIHFTIQLLTILSGGYVLYDRCLVFSRVSSFNYDAVPVWVLRLLLCLLPRLFLWLLLLIIRHKMQFCGDKTIMKVVEN